ncbi:helix-turn-helix domain-containing protein [Scandinavium sp. V105_16]|uniref:Helix-turn-helix domain-containing protein n=1 Tax=Scandinavium lactucae TaxID=3095028 RepID=A0AAJ2S819_9ENTR|nr:MULTISPECIES: helix-turn-helix domain-containing protein [unclassified Scandinavium]MDX6021589.1 helix-turn-helix domain-containing protein [Scandinavium sp. V105_16]MDX6031754.1 helix-turn-helix domain-containing protein [Scandinavium sp. V105_12]MDX6038730.1 helix-turn-helix domain-containing protein [Scandinavium sp. V105_6]MDX6049314.1 helix-turn-helix domain-containing protein [Scandinavium sp. V105_1]
MVQRSPIPVFKLYGEQRDWPTPELLHCESIHQRSSLYQWHIRVHQHVELVQLLYLHKGEACIEIEGETRVVKEASIQVVPSLCVHGFRFSPGTQGYVLSLALPLLSRFENQFGRQLAVLNQPHCVSVKGSRAHIRTLFSTLLEEYQQNNDARELMLHAMLSALLVWINRQCQSVTPAEDRAERRRAVMQQFARLIESHYREHLQMSEYAHAVGLSVTHLNYLCREFHNCSALNVLHQRLMLEAKRSLQYTSMSITQLSDYLGFSDATYFSRFFRRYAGVPPKLFREKIKDIKYV